MRKKRGQVTVFMIVGLIALFAFLLVFQLSSGIKKTELETAERQAFAKPFQKEALRIFVDDCLHDALEEGLIMIGKQGRIWNDQPGGRRSFVQGVTGTIFPGETEKEGGRVFYGISRKQYPEHQNAYPCFADKGFPSFCKWKFPQNLDILKDKPIGFGVLNLQRDTIEGDLRRYLSVKTVECVKGFTEQKISPAAKIEPATIDLKLEIKNDGISVRATYPLKFKVGEEGSFYLTEFDFFYPSQFRKLLDAAVILPLQWDYQYLDFEYTEDQLKKADFTYQREKKEGETTPQGCTDGRESWICTLRTRSEYYSQLGISFQKIETSEGDDIFVFRPAQYTVLSSPGNYVFRIARQNRPPALDYVGRDACADDDPDTEDYDYLVVKSDDANDPRGKIDFTLSARDPDEDVFGTDEGRYSIENDDSDGLPPETTLSDFFSEDFSAQIARFNKAGLSTWTEKIYKVKATARDKHGQEDSQDIRILVDRPMTTNLEVKMPYKLKWGGRIEDYNSVFPFLGTNEYYVSAEDPVFVEVKLPEESATEEISVENAKVVYKKDSSTTNVEFDLSSYYPSNKQFCYKFPGSSNPTTSLCGLSTAMSSYSTIPITSNTPFHELTENGKLNLVFGVNYCANNPFTAGKQLDIKVKECIPHYNQDYPYPYVESLEYHNLKMGSGGEESLVSISSPFLASHVCCDPVTWAPINGEVVAEKVGCYGRVDDFTIIKNTKSTNQMGFEGYVLEERVFICSDKGNEAESVSYRLKDNKLFCGNNDLQYCNNINDNCKYGDAWRFIPNQGWCHGTMGCAEYCTGRDKEVVADSGSGISVRGSQNLNQRALTNLFTDDSALKVHCGCSSSSDNTKPCDANFDGTFEGTCSSGACS